MADNSGQITSSQVAESTPFDNDLNGFVSDNVQDAIEEVKNSQTESTSTALTWGKGGSANSGEYLDNEDVESNKSGRLIPFDGFITTFYVNNEKSFGNKTLQIRRRRPCQTGAFTTIGTITVSSGNKCGISNFNPAIAVLAGDELSIRVANSSADFENPIVGLIIRDTPGIGSGGANLQTKDEGIVIESNTVSYNFTGAGVAATSDTFGNVTVDIQSGGGSGEINNATNVGSGTPIFRDKTGVNLNFRSLQGTNGITTSVNGNQVDIALNNAPDLDVNAVTSAVDVAGGLDVTAGWTNITFDNTTLENPNIGTHTPTTAPITIQKTGIYEVCAGVSLEQTAGNSRSQTAMRLQLNGVTISGSFAEMYSRNNSRGGDNASKSLPLSLTSGDILTLQAQRVSGAGTIKTVANSCYLNVKYLRSSN